MLWMRTNINQKSDERCRFKWKNVSKLHSIFEPVLPSQWSLSRQKQHLLPLIVLCLNLCQQLHWLLFGDKNHSCTVKRCKVTEWMLDFLSFSIIYLDVITNICLATTTEYTTLFWNNIMCTYHSGYNSHTSIISCLPVSQLKGIICTCATPAFALRLLYSQSHTSVQHSISFPNSVRHVSG